ncbi:hypothetical protein HAZT_HAZT011434 [Hyalella azteca]|uniref:Cdc37 C-terminal domain-containing protein n=1 Tax=Hyalella azteca TaxID=294128 RepID=A0A6A0H3N8_HYAAZ|nr:hypothetical protein HAZT_HAZT011434 [Hyalella azteca]
MGVNPHVNWLYSDLADGIIIFQLYDIIRPGIVDWKRVHTEGRVKGGVSEGRVSKGGVSEGRVSEGRVSEGRVSEGRVSEGRVSEGSVSEGRVSRGFESCVTRKFSKLKKFMEKLENCNYAVELGLKLRFSLELRACFESQDVGQLKSVIAAMDPAVAAHHMKRCVASGLWVPEGGATDKTTGLAAPPDEGDDQEPVYEAPAKTEDTVD